MSCSKPLPPFVCGSLYYMNRYQLERFSIVCRPLKYFIERYLHSKPYRVFDKLCIRGASYALIHKSAQWHPNLDDYSVQQFLADQKIVLATTYYSFDEMRPYLGPVVRINSIVIYVEEDFVYNPEHIAEMESITHLWRDGHIEIQPETGNYADNFQPILNSPTILQCRILDMKNPNCSFKDYKVLYTLKVITVYYFLTEIDLNSWQQFLEQPGIKPVIVFHRLSRHVIDDLFGRLSKAFSSADLPNAFKIGFVQRKKSLTEFRETNVTSGEVLELKKGLPTEYQAKNLEGCNMYTLERSSI